MVRTACLLGAVLLVACGGSQPSAGSAPLANTAQPAPPDARLPSRKEQAIATLERFADSMCRCTDVDCAQQVSDDMTLWAQDQVALNEDDLRMTEQEQRHATQIATRLAECMQGAMARPSAHP
jgi:hypothetical protein